MRLNENPNRTATTSPTLRDQLLRKLVENRSGQLIFVCAFRFPFDSVSCLLGLAIKSGLDKTYSR